MRRDAELALLEVRTQEHRAAPRDNQPARLDANRVVERRVARGALRLADAAVFGPGEARRAEARPAVQPVDAVRGVRQLAPTDPHDGRAHGRRAPRGVRPRRAPARRVAPVVGDRSAVGQAARVDRRAAQLDERAAPEPRRVARPHRRVDAEHLNPGKRVLGVLVQARPREPRDRHARRVEVLEVGGRAHEAPGRGRLPAALRLARERKARARAGRRRLERGVRRERALQARQAGEQRAGAAVREHDRRALAGAAAPLRLGREPARGGRRGCLRGHVAQRVHLPVRPQVFDAVRLRGDAAAVVDELPQVVDPRAQPRRVDVHARVVHLGDRRNARDVRREERGQRAAARGRRERVAARPRVPGQRRRARHGAVAPPRRVLAVASGVGSVGGGVGGGGRAAARRGDRLRGGHVEERPAGRRAVRAERRRDGDGVAAREGVRAPRRARRRRSPPKRRGRPRGARTPGARAGRARARPGTRAAPPRGRAAVARRAEARRVLAEAQPADDAADGRLGEPRPALRGPVVPAAQLALERPGRRDRRRRIIPRLAGPAREAVADQDPRSAGVQELGPRAPAGARRPRRRRRRIQGNADERRVRRSERGALPRVERARPPPRVRGQHARRRVPDLYARRRLGPPRPRRHVSRRRVRLEPGRVPAPAPPLARAPVGGGVRRAVGVRGAVGVVRGVVVESESESDGAVELGAAERPSRRTRRPRPGAAAPRAPAGPRRGGGGHDAGGAARAAAAAAAASAPVVLVADSNETRNGVCDQDASWRRRAGPSTASTPARRHGAASASSRSTASTPASATSAAAR